MLEWIFQGKLEAERTAGQGDKWHITAPNPLHFYGGYLIMMLHVKLGHPAAKEKVLWQAVFVRAAVTVRGMLLLQILEMLTSEYCSEKNRLMMLTLGGSSHLRTLKSTLFFQ